MEGRLASASTGSAPVASLKPEGLAWKAGGPEGIHGVCPRGLIEAGGRGGRGRGGSAHPRGLPPWPH